MYEGDEQAAETIFSGSSTFVPLGIGGLVPELFPVSACVLLKALGICKNLRSNARFRTWTTNPDTKTADPKIMRQNSINCCTVLTVDRLTVFKPLAM
jgi:hypothetical protein